MGLGRRRHRHRRHHRRGRGDQVADTEEARDVGFDEDLGGRRRGRRHSRSSSRSSRSSSRSSVTSVPSMLSAGSGRRHRHRHNRGGSIKDDVNAAFNTFYNVEIAGKKPVEWSSIPGKVKDVIAILKETWTWLQENASALKQLFRKTPKLAVVADKMESIGLGRHHAKRLAKKMVKHLLGGDAYDDKLKSFGTVLGVSVKGAYDTALKAYPKLQPIDKGVRPIYNAFAAVRDNADDIKGVVNSSPAPQKVKDTAAKIVDKIKNSGLGRKGKRAPSKRNMLVSKLMREHGLSLPEASRKASQMMKGGEGL